MKFKLRNYFFSLRKKKYFSFTKQQFNSLLFRIHREKKNIIGTYWAINNEVDLSILNKILFKKNKTLALPFINSKNEMEFKIWRKQDCLQLNKFGIAQTFKKSETVFPNIILTPLLAFNNFRYRLGYGSGYYDKYFNNLSKNNRKFTTIGIGFSFQKTNKFTAHNLDFPLDNIFTEKGFLN
jgi:5-formyltetrahydrofolate cyclo-ligase